MSVLDYLRQRKAERAELLHDPLGMRGVAQQSDRVMSAQVERYYTEGGEQSSFTTKAGEDYVLLSREMALALCDAAIDLERALDELKGKSA